MSPCTYFAYGANMNGGLLATRLGRSDPAGLRRRRGLLRDHALVFDKLSSTESGVGYANIVYSSGDSVEGVLNELEHQELLQLDGIELVPYHYTRRTATVADVGTSSLVLAEVYWAVPERMHPGLLPRRDYIEKLLGSADMLSPQYVERLRSVLVIDGSISFR